MAEVGDFILSMVQERAEKTGILAQVAVRRGIFSKVLREVIAEKQVNTVVLGSSPKETGLVSYERLQELSIELSKELGVEFIVVQDGTMVFHTET